jgi:quercetin dioxygenase-like cupin family protein
MKEIEVILKTDSVRARIMSLDPREIADWHYHTVVTDDIFCLTGEILVRSKGPDEENKLTLGKRCQIKAGRIHQLENLGNDEARYLLIQGVGKYDFNAVQK